jgi:hypothetical protein
MTWIRHCCDVGHRYELHGETDLGNPPLDCPLCIAYSGQTAELPDGILGRISKEDQPWKYLRLRRTGPG